MQMIHMFFKSIPQTHQEQWLIYRKVIQAWTESIANVAAKDLQPAEVEAVESAVLRSNRMDAEICSMLARRPRTKNLNMLPTCQSEAKADEVAQEVAKAHTEASHAKLAVFQAELRADWILIDEMRTAKEQVDRTPGVDGARAQEETAGSGC